MRRSARSLVQGARVWADARVLPEHEALPSRIAASILGGSDAPCPRQLSSLVRPLADTTDHWQKQVSPRTLAQIIHMHTFRRWTQPVLLLGSPCRRGAVLLCQLAACSPFVHMHCRSDLLWPCTLELRLKWYCLTRPRSHTLGRACLLHSCTSMVHTGSARQACGMLYPAAAAVLHQAM